MSTITWFRAVGLLTVIVTALTAFLVSHDAQAQDEAKGKKYALLVGVTAYDSKNFSTLNFSDNDAEQMESALKKAGFVSIRVLTSKRGAKSKADAPTTANIQAALAELVAKKTRHDTILVGLAGHGMQLEVKPDKGEGQAKQYSYFCPQNASLLGISYSTGKSDSLLLLDELFEQLSKSDAGHRLALIDACRNDSSTQATKRARIDVGKVTIPDGVGALFSCGRGQFAFETKELNHGVFFHHVIKGIEGEAKNRNGVVTWDSLADYVKTEVPNYVKTHFGKDGGNQTPASMGNLEGGTALVQYRADATKITPSPKPEDKRKRVPEDPKKGEGDYIAALKKGEAAWKAGNIDEARKHFEEAQKAKPNDPYTARLLNTLKRLDGPITPDKSRSVKDKPTDKDEKTDAKYNAAMKKANAALEAGNSLEALKGYGEALEAKPNDSEAFKGLKKATALSKEQDKKKK